MHGMFFARGVLAATASAAALLGWIAPAHAGLPKPVIERAQQANPLIYDAQLGSLDGNGRFDLHLVGQNLAPDDDGHPAQTGEYVHLVVRGIDASNVAGDWRKCGDDICAFYGSTARNVINVGIRPSYYLSQPGAHLQFKLWVSSGPSEANGPEDTYNSSPWSEVYTVDRAQAGVAAPVKDSPGPTLARLSPDQFSQMGSASGAWQLTAYGERVCGEPPQLVINGDVGNAVSATGRCMGYDEAGKPLSGKESRLVFDLPDRYRQLGSYSAVLLNQYGQSSAPLTFEVRGLRIRRDVVIAPRVGVDVERVAAEPIRPPEAAVPATPPVIQTVPVVPPKTIPILKMPVKR